MRLVSVVVNERENNTYGKLYDKAYKCKVLNMYNYTLNCEPS